MEEATMNDRELSQASEEVRLQVRGPANRGASQLVRFLSEPRFSHKLLRRLPPRRVVPHLRDVTPQTTKLSFSVRADVEDRGDLLCRVADNGEGDAIHHHLGRPLLVRHCRQPLLRQDAVVELAYLMWHTPVLHLTGEAVGIDGQVEGDGRPPMHRDVVIVPVDTVRPEGNEHLGSQFSYQTD